MSHLKTDVIVVGAGIAGLAAANSLREHGIEALVIEARDRVGGRLHNHTFANGDVVDIGGQWLGPGQDRCYRLLAELGGSRYGLFCKGDSLFRCHQKTTRYRGTIPKLNPLYLAEIGWLMWRFERMAAQISPEDPMSHPRARDWDSRTLHSWLQSNCISETAFDLFATGVAAVFAAEPREISLLHALFYARSGNGWNNLLTVEGGAQQDRVVGGTATLCTGLANKLQGRVFLNQPVRSINWKARKVTVVTATSEYQGRIAILALPPNQIRRLIFEPSLPPDRDQLWQKMPGGTCIKCIAQYDEPFWRATGLSGQSVALQQTVRVTFDNTAPDAKAGLLMGFIEGDLARQWGTKSDTERRREVLQNFANVFGDRALSPMDYVDRDWAAEPYTRGCYTALKGPGTWTSYGNLGRVPIGALHFAGTETASEWYGYIEGGLQSAERVTAEARTIFDV